MYRKNSEYAYPCIHVHYVHFKGGGGGGEGGRLLRIRTKNLESTPVKNFAFFLLMFDAQKRPL